MYEGVITRSVGLKDNIPVDVGLHQVSSLNPYLFAMIMDVLACGIKDISPWCMSDADDILYCVAPEERTRKINLKSGKGYGIQRAYSTHLEDQRVISRTN